MTVMAVRESDYLQHNHYIKRQNNQQLSVDYPNGIYTHYGNCDKPQAYNGFSQIKQASVPLVKKLAPFRSVLYCIYQLHDHPLLLRMGKMSKE